jgi:hypothetical protein
LQGCCGSPDSVESAPLRAGDAIDGVRGGRLNMRAIVDSDVLRVPRQSIRRLMDRWPAMLRSGAPSSLGVRPPPIQRKGHGRILCLMPLSRDVPYAEFSSVCAETIAKEREAVLMSTDTASSAEVTDVFRLRFPGLRTFSPAGERSERSHLAARLRSWIVPRCSFDMCLSRLRGGNSRGSNRDHASQRGCYPILRQNAESLSN